MPLLLNIFAPALKLDAGSWTRETVAEEKEHVFF